MKISYLVCSVAFALGSAHAAITYVDAVEGGSGNTFATGGSLANTSWLSTNNAGNSIETQWDKRSPFGNGDVVFQSSHFIDDVGGDQMPELTTRVTGLSDGIYDVWVFFWDNNGGLNNWTISAGLTSGSLTTYSFDGLGDQSQTVAASTLTFTADPEFTELTRTMYAVKLGQSNVVGGSSIDVFVDNLVGSGTNNRVWYDGVGYELIPEPSSALLVGLSAGIGLLRRRRH